MSRLEHLAKCVCVVYVCVCCRLSEAGGCLFSPFVFVYLLRLLILEHSFSLLELICSSAFTPAGMRARTSFLWPSSAQALVINYEEKRRRPPLSSGNGDSLDAEAGGAVAVQLALDLLGGGGTIDRGPAEQIAARLDVTAFLSPWASRRIPLMVSSNQNLLSVWRGPGP